MPLRLKSFSTSREVPWDERAAPAVVSIWLLAGVAVAWVAATGNQPWTLENGRLVTATCALAASALVASFLVVSTSSRRVPRRSVVSLCVSLAFNLLIVWWFTQVTIWPHLPARPTAIAKREESSSTSQVTEIVALVPERHAEEVPEILRPTETGSAEAGADPVAQRATDFAQQAAPRPEDAGSTATSMPQPRLLERQQDLASVPRYNEDPNLLSSQRLPSEAPQHTTTARTVRDAAVPESPHDSSLASTDTSRARQPAPALQPDRAESAGDEDAASMSGLSSSVPRAQPADDLPSADVAAASASLTRSRSAAPSMTQPETTAKVDHAATAAAPPRIDRSRDDPPSLAARADIASATAPHLENLADRRASSIDDLEQTPLASSSPERTVPKRAELPEEAPPNAVAQDRAVESIAQAQSRSTPRDLRTMTSTQARTDEPRRRQADDASPSLAAPSVAAMRAAPALSASDDRDSGTQDAAELGAAQDVVRRGVAAVVIGSRAASLAEGMPTTIESREEGNSARAVRGASAARSLEANRDARISQAAANRIASQTTGRSEEPSVAGLQQGAVVTRQQMAMRDGSPGDQGQLLDGTGDFNGNSSLTGRDRLPSRAEGTSGRGTASRDDQPQEISSSQAIEGGDGRRSIRSGRSERGVDGVGARARLVETSPNGQATGTKEANDLVPRASAGLATGRDRRAPSDRLPDAPSGLGLPVPLDVEPGSGGVGLARSLDAGVRSRQAVMESTQIVDSSARFVRRQASGPLAINTSVPMPAKAFAPRLRRRGVPDNEPTNAADQQRERAIELGLRYLESLQASDGSWSFQRAGAEPTDNRSREAIIHSDAAATGLALLSFLGAGYHHQSDRYADVVARGLQFLTEHQRPDGDLYLPQDAESNRSAWLYTHGIATIALCEAYGMTQDPLLHEPAQKAIDFAVGAQHPKLGGWRYSPGVGADTSVSGWMVMAMRSAELANLEVPLEAWQGVEKWLGVAQMAPDRADQYRYNPFANEAQRHGRRPTKTMTSVGLLMRLYFGTQRDAPELQRGSEYLSENLPSLDPLPGGLSQRDTYYWYYATQVMFHLRGDRWEQWHRRLHQLLTTSQVSEGELAGSWDPWVPVPDLWARHGGRLYVTTLNLLSLEVHYRHLPIYDETDPTQPRGADAR